MDAYVGCVGHPYPIAQTHHRSRSRTYQAPCSYTYGDPRGTHYDADPHGYSYAARTHGHAYSGGTHGYTDPYCADGHADGDQTARAYRHADPCPG